MNEVSFSRKVREVRFGEWVLDPKSQRIFDGEVSRELEPLIFKLLCYFIVNNESVVTRQDLVESVWCQRYVDDNAINRAMSELRKILRSNKQQGIVVKTHYSKGYSFFLEPEIIYFENTSESYPHDSAPKIFPPRTAFIFYFVLAMLITSLIFVFISFKTRDVDVREVSVDEKTISWLEGSYNSIIIHPSERFIAFEFTPEGKGFSSVIVRNLVTNQENMISHQDVNLSPSGWSLKSSELFVKKIRNNQCEIWKVDLEDKEKSQKFVMNCDERQRVMAGISDETIIYSKFGYRNNNNLSTVVIRNIKSGDEYQITSPSLSSFGDNFLYFDEQGKKVYFERVQFGFTELMVTDIEGTEVKSLYKTEGRIWRVSYDKENDSISWFDNINQAIVYFSLNKFSVSKVEKLDKKSAYSLAYNLSNNKIIAVSVPYSFDIYDFDLQERKFSPLYVSSEDEFKAIYKGEFNAYLKKHSNGSKELVLTGSGIDSEEPWMVGNILDFDLAEKSKTALFLYKDSFKVYDLITRELRAEVTLKNYPISIGFKSENVVFGLIKNDKLRQNQAFLYDLNAMKMILLPLDKVSWFAPYKNGSYIYVDVEGSVRVKESDGSTKNVANITKSYFIDSFALREGELFHSDGKNIFKYRFELGDFKPELITSELPNNMFINNIYILQGSSKLVLDTVSVSSNSLIYADTNR
ncbi:MULTISPECIES: winged helix-turn-helix domain-containing protein [Pseudoalteromonas]|uniref:winged helix-turn-helix domain-containing protein n=1 Tax=Pseudoalteromonas TaxID=53246 RepID=UPI0002E619A5|nr:MULTISPECIES: winged helix-turn-helix domain-containing protein [Pseudoalteromonas]MDP4489998.1 winged helix-turn-helix domain-containing protein [Pseudoalteromonas piscicida]